MDLQLLRYLMPACSVIVLICFVGAALLLLWKLQIIRYLEARHLKVLEVTPPAFSPRTSAATAHFFSLLHGLYRTRSLKQRLLGRPASISLEIVASRSAGIRYRVIVDESLLPPVRHAIQSYLNNAKISEADYTPEPQKPVTTTYKQHGYFAYPLALLNNTDEHDPVAYLGNAMENLNDGESICLQFVISPFHSREARKLSSNVMGNSLKAQHLSKDRNFILHKVGEALSRTLFALTDLMNEAMYTSGKHETNKLQNKNSIQPSNYKQQLLQTVSDKVTNPLFNVGLRVAFMGMSDHEVRHRRNAITSALTAFDNGHFQGLRTAKVRFLGRYRSYLYLHRLPDLLIGENSILSARELASLYHFPLGQQSRADNLVASMSRTLAAPISLKSDAKFDITIGANNHRGIVTPIGLSLKDRERHVYIIGGTGNGKTTMLQYAIVQDMIAGNGIAVIDPHGDMSELLLRHVPEDRVRDVIYFNPDDLDYPIGLNLLELTPGLSGKELLREKDLITETVISVFRKIFSDEDNGGHRIEYVLRNAIQTALTVEGATLFTVFDLLNNPSFRRSVIKTLDDENLINFWKNELGKAGDMQKVKMAAGITAKIGRFLFSASAKQILEQPRSTIDFDNIIDSGKILICNFSKGLLGEDTSELFGITVLAKLQLASLRRARLKQSERRAFYLYVDEFQNFATTSFVQMLSESRKYKLYLTMAEQSTSQQDDQRMVSIILANVGTVICFRTGNPQDERLLLPLFKPFIEEGEISNLPSFNFYARITATNSQEPLSGETVLLKDEGSEDIANKVIAHSRDNYAHEAKSVETSKPLAKKPNHKKKPKVNANEEQKLDVMIDAV